MSASPSLRNRINTVVRDIPRSGIRDFFDIVTTMKDVISLGIGEPDFDTPWHVREATVHALERGATHYSSNLGYIELRRALSKYVARNVGAEYNPDNEVLVTVGVSEALDELALLEPALAQLVDLKFFCGFTVPEIAELQGISERSVQRQWEKARLLLYRALSSD